MYEKRIQKLKVDLDAKKETYEEEINGLQKVINN